MTDSFKILTQRHKGESHRETEVMIDWTGITERELYILARRAIVYNLQVHIQKYHEGPFPTEVKINAVEAARDHTPAITTVFAPKVQRVLNSVDAVEELLKQLTPDQLKELEKML